ncbi:Os11g0195650, partial [Oryza sativa Japonica Group]
AERPVHLERVDHVGDGAGGGGDGDDEAGGAEDLEAEPPRAPSPHAALRDVHLDGEVDGERPERDGAEEPHHVAEEREEHGHDGGGADERRAPCQAEHAEREGAHAELPGDEAAVRPPRRRPPLDEREDRLDEHLVGADEVHDDGSVGDVEQPERLVEAEPGEQVVRRLVPERRVPHAPAQHVEHRRRRHAHHRRALHHLRLRWRRRLDRVLDLDEDDGVGVGERDVTEGLEAAPDLLHGGDAGADANAGEAAHEPAVGDGLRDAEREANRRIGEGHDGGDDGQPPYLIEIRDL